MSTERVELDGSFGEGGGQILRTSLALSLLTGRGFHLKHIRARRSKPGLQPQHLMCVKAAAAIGDAGVRGASLGSTDLVFDPGTVTAGNYRFDIGTAGATSLLLHTLYLPLALKGARASSLTLVGGTHVEKSPCYHFLDITWRPWLAQLGLDVRLQMVHPGFYPRGGGVVEVHIEPCTTLRGIEVGARQRFRLTGFSAVASLPEDIALRQARRAVERLEAKGYHADIKTESWEGGPGTVLGLCVQTTPVPAFFFGLGARGKRAERVADEAVEQVLAYLASDALVDPHSADQLLLPLALAPGPSTYRVGEVTSHLLTNIDVICAFVNRDILCEGEAGATGTVRIV
jgi:RNA 3'-terminal phosphate cyclase (ATP)